MNPRGKQVVVMGLGRFGGGLGVTQWLLEQGAKVLLTDLASEDELSEQLSQLGTHPNLTVVCGSHPEHAFKSADMVIANPAIPAPWDNPFLRVAWDAGVEVTTEIHLVVHQLDRLKVIGVTGTAGKSTTAAMIHAALVGSDFIAHLGGNIGGSLLDQISSFNSNDIVVLELSSAMLWWLDEGSKKGWSPHIAVLTNIEPNHIDWHGSFRAYKDCKRAIFKYQIDGDTALVQDPCATFDDLSVQGKHNERNASVALLAAVAIGADERRARENICTFRGLPHRLQCVRSGYYNDSKSTTPSASKIAVDAFDDPTKIHLIVGGYDKHIDLTLLAEQSSRVACMYTIGATGNAILQLASGNVQECGTLEKSVSIARSNMQSGDVLLMSPGCASWDQFDNYEQRGELFCSLVGSIS